MWFCGISKLIESNIHETVKFSHLYFCANNTLFVQIIQLLMIKPVIIIAQLFIAFILFLFRILLSIGHVLWKMVIWILLFIWKVFFWPVRFIASLIWKLLPNRVKLL